MRGVIKMLGRIMRPTAARPHHRTLGCTIGRRQRKITQMRAAYEFGVPGRCTF